MTRHLFTAAALRLILATGAISCSDPSGPDGSRSTVVETPRTPPTGMVVSNAVANATAYVSAAPGTFQNGLSAVLRNRTRASAPRSVQMIDGGFDPVAVDARVGDELAVTVSVVDGARSYAIWVPDRKAPAVVRVRPANYGVDVALSVAVLVVFSEPVDKASVTTSSLGLFQDASAVDGAVRVSVDALSAEFTPAAPLEHLTSYSIAINEDIHDLDADALAEASSSAFVTIPLLPDGELAFTMVSDGQIYRATADGRSLTRLTRGDHNYGPAWSPDGRRIAFAKNSKGPVCCSWGITDIYLMDADGSNVVRRTIDAEFWSAAWSPDGRTLAISNEGVYYSDIHVISAEDDGSLPRLLATDARSPAWSPDGNQIAYVHTSGDDGYHQVYVMAADGTGARPLTEHDGGAIFGVAWSPDGKRLAYSKCLAGTRICNLYVMNANGGAASLITGSEHARGASWSPDGKWIAFTVSTYAGSEWQPSIAYVPADGGTTRIVVSGGANPSWRP